MAPEREPALLARKLSDGFSMPEPTEEDVELARDLLAQWDEGRGVSKSRLEIKTWNDATSHGRHFDRFVQNALGVSTNRRSRQSDRIADLEAQVRGLGRHPVGAEPPLWEIQLQHAREACLQALRIWNDPTTTFRAGGFATLFVTAWNSLAIAVLDRRGQQWRDLDCDGEVVIVEGVEKSRSTRDLVAEVLSGPEHAGARANLNLWIDLRNAVVHRSLPALDATVIPHAQAGLLNFENRVVDEFGPIYALADSLSVPLQLSGFRDPGVLASRRQLLSSLPLDVQAVLSRAEAASDDLLADPTFMLRVAFIPAVPGSGRSPDAIAYFVRPGEVPDELTENLERYVVLAKPHRSACRFRATEVVDEVTRRTGYKLHWVHHSAAARELGAWPAAGEQDETVDARLAEYNSAFKRWLYSQAWIDLLVDNMSTVGGFQTVTGREPKLVAGPSPAL